MPRATRQTKNISENPGPAVKLPRRRGVAASSAALRKDDDDDGGTNSNYWNLENEQGEVGVKETSEVRKQVKISKKPAGLSENGQSRASTSHPTANNNILKGLDLLLYGPKQSRLLQIKSIQNHFVQKSIKQLSGADYVGRFTRRITSLAWHDKHPYFLASASKFGDIMLISGQPNFSSDAFEMNFETKAELQGGGAGYSITAMKFHKEDMGVLYRASIDCTVARIDIVHGETTKFYDTEDYHRWFCGMDVNFSRNMILAGDNKGTGYEFSLEGKKVNQWRLHKNKIHHIEFSKRDPNLLVTSSLDKAEAVRIWDVRFLKATTAKDSRPQPLQSLPHACGLNCAKFSPSDGSRLLTSDQHNELRVYQGPLWKDYLTIKHHHKQFQHITPIKADWHPVNDYIVIGRYPEKQMNNKGARAIQFFDSYSGELVDMIYPPLNEICSLNAFNITGEYLATGMNSKLILWKPAISLEVGKISKQEDDPSKASISESMRNVLRGRRAREYSPPESDDDDKGTTSQKKKRSKTSASTNSTTSSVLSAATKKTASRKKKK